MAEIREKLQRFEQLAPESQNELFFSLGKIYLQIAGVSQTEIDDIYSRLEDYEFWSPKYTDETGIKPGMDIMDAFRCLVDVRRTRVLVEGIQKTIDSIKGSSEGPIAIDAGTGTGILAMTCIAAGCRKVYALEINPDTARITRQFIEHMGFSDQIELIECDATQVDLGILQADLLVSENLSNGLFDEPQYEIINHLTQYLKEDASIVPVKGELFVSLAYASWEGIDKPNIAVRKLPDLQKLTAMQRYFEVKSHPGLNLKAVSGVTEIFVPDGTPPNTLIISTRYQINDGPDPVFLEPDSCHFLGKSSAFKLEKSPEPGSVVCIDLQYPTGMPRKYSEITQEGDNIVLRPDKDHGGA